MLQSLKGRLISVKRLQRWAKKQVMQAKCNARSILFGEDSAHITHAGKIRFKALLSKSRLL